MASREPLVTSTAGNIGCRAKEDDTCRAIAEQISQARPLWLVIWGNYTRRFCAFPLFDMRPRMLVTAGYPDALLPRLDDAEHRFASGPDSTRR
jgi:hypothetical protein